MPIRSPLSQYTRANRDDKDAWGTPRWYIKGPKRNDGEHDRPLKKHEHLYQEFICQVCDETGWVLKQSIGGKPRAFPRHKGCIVSSSPNWNRDPSETELSASQRDPDKVRNYKICGHKLTRSDGVCQQARGWKTDHPGYGACRYHGGLTPSGIKFAAKEYAMSLLPDLPVLGNPVDIDPQGAILDEVRRTVGHVEWLGMMIRLLGTDPNSTDDELKTAGNKIKAQGMSKTIHQFTQMGIQPSVWINMYTEERKHLVSVCKAAVAMGVAERQVALAEEQGRLLAAVIKAVLSDDELELTPAQLVKAPHIVRRHLLSLPAAGQTSSPSINDDDEWEDVS